VCVCVCVCVCVFLFLFFSLSCRLHFASKLFLCQDVPSEQGFRLFSIDPREHSKFEIANHLWSMMEGSA
jgi:hypothetical protein